jgi:hypothetical protein
MFCLLILCACKPTQELAPIPFISSFNFIGFNPTSTIIDEAKKTITITLPFNSNVSALTPKIEISSGASIIPASGVAQDFKKSIFYTLTSKDGQKVIYTVIVTLTNLPSPEITTIKSDTVEAGFDFEILGKNFGKFGLDVQTFLVDASNKEIEVKNRLIDSTKINISTAIETLPAFYNLRLKIKNQEVVSAKKLWVSYPSPQIKTIEKQFYINSDILWLAAKYVDINKYKLYLQIENGAKSTKLEIAKTNGENLAFVIPENLQASEYSVKLFNQSENKLSREAGFHIEIFDAKKPFVNEIINPKASYKKGENVLFKTINFDKLEVRFYQISLVGLEKTYIQNGIFDASKKTLSLDLPNNLVKGNYKINFGLTEPIKNVNYSFQSNLSINVVD